MAKPHRQHDASGTCEKIDPDGPVGTGTRADLVLDRYRCARLWRVTDRIGRHTVEQTLQNSYRQYHSILDPRDAQLVADSGIDLGVSITKHKTDVLVAWIRDLLLNSADAPFVVEPTPIAELSPAGKAQVVQQVKNPDKLMIGSIM
ncbi:hypothetical protein [Paraburkholderia sacchari]|uniref:hypothetical protein n=1 Tax=Paraburkholderia sacchari TaxID=159450 RepID=UPI000543B2F1|nr:hypothetical protein [Paraburkholderia sacchari]NLP59614.1 hypothetical protein [Paraburkholderia sacchari]